MAGPAPLRDDERSAKAKTPTKTVLEVEVLPARMRGAPPPAPPAALSPSQRTDWLQLWESELAGLIATTDLPALSRLFELRSRYDYLIDLAFTEAEPIDVGDDLTLAPPPPGLAYGSQGQLVEHPALKAALSVARTIEALEDRFALTLKARQNTGIRMGAVADAAAKVAAAEAAKESSPRADPRVTVPGPAAPQPRRPGGDVDGDKPPPRRRRPRK